MLIALVVHLAGTVNPPDYYLVDPGTFQAFLAVVGIAMVALAGYSANKARVNAKKIDAAAVQTAVIKDSVVNDHKKPDGSNLGLRDDNDAKHTESMAAIEAVAQDLRTFAKTTNRRLDTVGRDIGGIRQELRDVRSHDETSDGRILELEKTTPRGEVRKAAAAVRTRKSTTRKATT